MALQSALDADMLRACADELAAPLVTFPLSEPFRGPAVWTGAELKESVWWGHMMSQDDIEDLIQAIALALKTVQWRAPGVPEVIPSEIFPLGGAMAGKLQGLAVELEHGKGPAMICNMPVDDPRLTAADLAVRLRGVSGHLGHAAMQSSPGLCPASRGDDPPLGRGRAERPSGLAGRERSEGACGP